GGRITGGRVGAANVTVSAGAGFPPPPAPALDGVGFELLGAGTMGWAANLQMVNGAQVKFDAGSRVQIQDNVRMIGDGVSTPVVENDGEIDLGTDMAVVAVAHSLNGQWTLMNNGTINVGPHAAIYDIVLNNGTNGTVNVGDSSKPFANQDLGGTLNNYGLFRK